MTSVSNQITVVVRCDAGPNIGFGHLARCRTLAQALRQSGAHPIMVGPDAVYRSDQDAAIFEDWVPVGTWSDAKSDAIHLVSTAKRYGADWAILDDYRVDPTYQEVLQSSGLQWLQFDGKANQDYWADIVLATNISLTADDYAGKLRKSGAELLSGPRHTLLRPEFPPEKAKQHPSDTKTVLITFGGGDDRSAILKVLAALVPNAPPYLAFNVMAGQHNPNLDAIQAWIDGSKSQRVKLFVNPNCVATLYRSADLAVMASGMSSFEAACSGVPMILTSIAENQFSLAQAWDNLGAAVNLGPLATLEDDRLITAFNTLINDQERRCSMAQTGLKLVDGKGATRVATALLCR